MFKQELKLIASRRKKLVNLSSLLASRSVKTLLSLLGLKAKLTQTSQFYIHLQLAFIFA